MASLGIAAILGGVALATPAPPIAAVADHHPDVIAAGPLGNDPMPVGEGVFVPTGGLHTDADPVVSGRKLVITLHDTVALDWPQAEGRMSSRADRLLRRAHAVVTVSEFSRQSLYSAFEVPPDWLNTTARPPETRLFPAASFACSVSVATAPEVSAGELTETIDRLIAAAPGVTTTTGRVDVTGLLPIVAPIVAPVPARTPVKFAV